MVSLLQPFMFRGVRYLVERVERPDDTVLNIAYILRGSRGRSYGLIRTVADPALFIVVRPRGLFSFWPTPFDGFRFRVMDDKLVIADDYE